MFICISSVFEIGERIITGSSGRQKTNTSFAGMVVAPGNDDGIIVFGKEGLPVYEIVGGPFVEHPLSGCPDKNKVIDRGAGG